MRNFLVWLILIMCSGSHTLAQQSVESLEAKHSAALQKYLTRNPQLEFLSESSYDADELKFIRREIKAGITPYYAKGDFNNDKVRDFALLLSDSRGKIEDTGLDEPFRYRHQLRLVVFNGSKNGVFQAVFARDLPAPLVGFINLTGGRRPRLSFAVPETDESFILTPKGAGYIAEYPNER